MIVNLVRRSEQTENKAVQQTDLRAPVRLAFANHMDVAGDRAPSSPEGAKILTRAAPALDRAMILFQYIVEILHRSMSTVLLQNALGFELYNGRRVSGVLVGVDDPRVRMVRTTQGFGQKALGGHGVAPGRKKEVDGRPDGIHRAV